MYAPRPRTREPRAGPLLAPWIKASYTVCAAAVLAACAARPAAGRYWFADIALLASIFALWYEQRLLASMTALAVLIPALAWIIGFLALVLGGVDPFGLARSWFAPQFAPPARLAAAAHVALPLVSYWLVYRLGYDPRAFRAQTFLAWAVLVLGVALAPVFAGGAGATLAMTGDLRTALLPGWLWVAVLMIVYPALVYLPAHLLLQELFGPAQRRLYRRLLARPAPRPQPLIAGPDGRERGRAPGRALQARLRGFADFALVRRRRR